MTVSIRDAQPDDAEDISNVQIATWQSAYRDILPTEFLAALSAGLERRAQWWGEQIVSMNPYEAAGWTADGSVKDDRIGDVAVREVRYRIALRNQS